MKRPLWAMPRALFVGAWLVASSALAQFELDLTEPKGDPQLRPTLAVLGVVAQDNDETTRARAKLAEQELVQYTTQGDDFKTVMEPSTVAKQLPTPVAKCIDWSCLEQAGKKLKVDRVLLVFIKHTANGSSATLYGFDPGLPEIITATDDSDEKEEHAFAGVAGKSQREKDREYAKKLRGFFATTLPKLATANGTLVIDNVDPSAAVSIDGNPSGVGKVQLAIQRGNHKVRVTGDGFLPFETDAMVDPTRTTTVRVALVAKPIERPVVVAPPPSASSAFYKRPGLYVAVAGVAVAAIGLGFGASAKGTEARATDANGDGVLDITRSQAKAARGQAVLANVFVTAGILIFGGGTVWFFVTPTAAAPVSTEPQESAGGGFGGVYGAVGGRF